MYNPYYNYQRPQQVVQVNGRASVDTIQLPPNSSILVMDTSAPIVWLCVSDGIGKVTATPYDITEHKEEAPIDTKTIEQRLTSIEKALSEIEEKMNAEPDVIKPKSRKDIPN